MTETIFALASGSARAAISVIRVSGPRTSDILVRLSGDLPAPRRAVVRSLRDASGALVDHGLVLWFPGPRSYTGEDSAELQIHGGRAVLLKALEALAEAGARQAQHGEFTRRAFLNGRMDLLEAEGVADLVAAETEAQRVQALRQMDGAPSAELRDWADRLRRLLAWQEALIDFPDEDLPAETEAALNRDLAALVADIARAAADGTRGVKLREGLVAVVVGAPNVGKSSLVNALVRRDVSIVAPMAGTTRDVVEATVELGGVPVTFVDTAGLRETSDFVEAEGVRRARQRAVSADLILFVIDAADSQGMAESPVGAFPDDIPSLVIANKIDLAPAPAGTLGVSATTAQGLDALAARLAGLAHDLTVPVGSVVLTRMRHVAALADACAALRQALAASLPELRGEDLRQAMRCLGTLTGDVDVEAILDTVFGSFCIGK